MGQAALKPGEAMTELDRVLDLLPQRFQGPGGVAGVVRDGRVIARRAWGYADTAARLPMTAATRLPICSISKQFTCALLLDLVADPASLNAAVADLLPNFTGALPTIQNLADNQSGLRDYWALTVLHGAQPEQHFGQGDALPLIATTKTGHFAPGTSYSYANNNFRILAEVLERHTGRTLDDLLTTRLFTAAGMKTAALLPDTRQNADGVVGYEGDPDAGYIPARNGIHWQGDAGISATLDDMLAYEAHIDATRNDPASLYNRLSTPPRFAFGSAAAYGNGLSHEPVAGRASTGHGGALRGFRAHRRHVASERLSVVVMFNHEGDAHGAAVALLEAALGHQADPPLPCPPGWDGLWLDQTHGLLVRLTAAPDALTLSYGAATTRLIPGPDGSATGDGVTVRRQGGHLWMHRSAENLTLIAQPVMPVDGAYGTAIAGRYWSQDLDAALHIDARDGAVFAGFDGRLGRGPMERMYSVADGIWAITNRRSMDAPAPGEWTVQVRRDSRGVTTGLVIGCWLARGVIYDRQD